MPHLHIITLKKNVKVHDYKTHKDEYRPMNEFTCAELTDILNEHYWKFLRTLKISEKISFWRTLVYRRKGETILTIESKGYPFSKEEHDALDELVNHFTSD